MKKVVQKLVTMFLF